MTKKARMSTQDVTYAVDDPNKPFMDGSDDDFSDLDGELDEDDDNDEDMDIGTQLTPHSPPASSPATTPPPGSSPVGTPSTTPPPGTLPAVCGPQACNQSPSHLSSQLLVRRSLYPTLHWKFLSCFLPPLMQMIVDESNR